MGHLTYISDEVCKLWEKCSGDFEGEGGGIVDGGLRQVLGGEGWVGYVEGVLRETKERDHQPLGGVRPNQGGVGGALGGMMMHFGGGAGGGGGFEDGDVGKGTVSVGSNVLVMGDSLGDVVDFDEGGSSGSGNPFTSSLSGSVSAAATTVAGKNVNSGNAGNTESGENIGATTAGSASSVNRNFQPIREGPDGWPEANWD
jgi:hypothetical protein